jgi:hypothetical protein
MQRVQQLSYSDAESGPIAHPNSDAIAIANAHTDTDTDTDTSRCILPA